MECLSIFVLYLKPGFSCGNLLIFRSLSAKIANRAAAKIELKKKIYRQCRVSQFSEIAALLRPKASKSNRESLAKSEKPKTVSSIELLDPKIEGSALLFI